MFRLTESPIDVAAVEAAVADPGAGATVTFVGRVRDNSRGRTVEYLEYHAYDEMAVRMMERIGTEMGEQFPCRKVAMVHRVGHLEVGEISIAITVATAHRAEAFEACRYAIDRVKQIVPIWKREVWTDGEEWVGIGA